MKTYKVVIEGIKPLLMNNGAQIGSGNTGAKRAGEGYGTPEEQAAKTCYWTEDKSSLAIPADNVHAAMKSAAGQYKVTGGGRKSVKPFVAGSVEIVPDLIPLGTKTHKIDSRRAVVKRSGILRIRAKMDIGWKLPFHILVEDDFPDPTPGITLKRILEEAGRRVGLGDFRPACNGKFGKFAVIEFSEVKGR
jgi:hypothetical protein